MTHSGRTSLELSKRGRKWVFTINNWTQGDQQRLIAQFGVDGTPTGKITFLIFGEETAPTTGTPHLQGYLELKTKMTGSAIKKMLLIPNIILIKSTPRATVEQQRVYCSKEGHLNEYGSPMVQGARTDLNGMRQLILDGASNLELAEANFGAYIRYGDAMNKYRHLVTECQRTWMPEIIIYWGPTGTGKSSKVYADESLDQIWSWPGNHQFYQGYHMQDIALFDDFYGSINLQYMLKLCDRYPMVVNIKNGHCNWQPRKIYFTSNIDPRRWWANEDTAKVAAFFRRVHEKGRIEHFTGIAEDGSFIS